MAGWNIYYSPYSEMEVIKVIFTPLTDWFQVFSWCALREEIVDELPE